MIKLFQSKVLSTANGQLPTDLERAPGSGRQAPGQISQITNYELLITCRDGTIAISEVQLEGKRRMSVEDFLRGNPVETGVRFGEG